MSKTGIFVGGFAVGALAMAIVASVTASKAEQRLKTYADSVAIVSDSAVERAREYAGVLQHRADSLALNELNAKNEAHNAETTARGLRAHLAQAGSASDSVAALLPLVYEADTIITEQHDALQAADAQIAALQLRGDSLDVALQSEKKRVRELDDQVDRLNHGLRLPKWASIGFNVLRYGLAAKGAYDVVRGR